MGYEGGTYLEGKGTREEGREGGREEEEEKEKEKERWRERTKERMRKGDVHSIYDTPHSIMTGDP